MIVSRKPITRPARAELTFPDMKITSFSAVIVEGKMRVTATLRNFNDVTQEFDPERHSFSIHIDDLAAASQMTIRIAKILTELDAVVQLVYDVQFIEHAIDQAITDGKSTAQLRIDLKVAQDALNADPDAIRAR